MPTGTISSSINVGGISMSSLVTRTKDGQIGHEVAMVAADDGVQLGFVGVNEVTVTLAAGNLVGDGDTVDVFWDVSGVMYVKYGVTVALVGQVATLTGGAGDDYVTGEGTLAMNIAEQITVDTDFVGNEVEMIATASDKNSHVSFIESGPAVITGIKIVASEFWNWVKNGEYTNPLAGKTVIELKVTNGDPDAAATLKVGVLYNSA